MIGALEMRGGGAQILCPLYILYILGQFGDAQIFWNIDVKKKWYKMLKLGEGGGVEEIWTKSKRTATFFGKPFLNLN